MKELSAQELKSNPVAGYYRWKHGQDTTYHCGLARIFCDDEVERSKGGYVTACDTFHGWIVYLTVFSFMALSI
ncbi:MAG: hypothetical protein IMF11_08930 [Proteobacteria bacterium]|nr:hypothetical protein [Pseudomonadota bacterium]